MTVQDFTADELATLQRFQDSPHAPEASVFDMWPLVPTGPIQHAYEIAPEPDTITGTAADWSRHFLVDSLAQTMLGRYLMHQVPDLRDAPVATVQEMSEAYHEAATSFLLGYLLRHVSDDVARKAAQIVELGDIGEWSWPWLVEAGVDPHLIKTPETRAERLESGERRRAERRAREAAA